MNATAVLLVFGLVVVALAFSLRAVLRQPVFALRHRGRGRCRAQQCGLAAGQCPAPLAGQLLEPEPAEARAAFEAAPWVRHAKVRRVWPMKLQVQLEEHHAAALGSCAAMVPSPRRAAAARWSTPSARSSRPTPATSKTNRSPTLSGPPGTAPDAAHVAAAVQPAARPGRRRRGAGAHRTPGAVQPRVLACPVCRRCRDRNRTRQRRRDRGPGARFVQTLPQITSRYRTALLSADLRHQDGYAVRLRGVSTQTPSTRPGKPAKQNR